MKLTMIFPISKKRMIPVLFIKFSFVYKIVKNGKQKRKIIPAFLAALIVLLKRG